VSRYEILSFSYGYQYIAKQVSLSGAKVWKPFSTICCSIQQFDNRGPHPGGIDGQDIE
jgi:hypothetical protein